MWGCKAHGPAATRRLRRDEPGDAFPLKFWPQCVRAGLRIIEIPVRRIYRDSSREFGGTLDDPAARLQHYLQVLMCELRSEPETAGACKPIAECCRTDPR